jgi:hypothetical protein
MDQAMSIINTLTAIDKMNYLEYPYLNKFHSLSKEILCPSDVVVRVYVLEIWKIKPKDLLSFSDPFLMLKLGDQKIDDVENRQEDKENMQVYRKFE